VRVRGLKLVAESLVSRAAFVAPRAGAWIETLHRARGGLTVTSHPVRVRGLKLSRALHPPLELGVAPRAGAWIETLVVSFVWVPGGCRTPCGCVD